MSESSAKRAAVIDRLSTEDAFQRRRGALVSEASLESLIVTEFGDNQSAFGSDPDYQSSDIEIIRACCETIYGSAPTQDSVYYWKSVSDQKSLDAAIREMILSFNYGANFDSFMSSSGASVYFEDNENPIERTTNKAFAKFAGRLPSPEERLEVYTEVLQQKLGPADIYWRTWIRTAKKEGDRPAIGLFLWKAGSVFIRRFLPFLKGFATFSWQARSFIKLKSDTVSLSSATLISLARTLMKSAS